MVDDIDNLCNDYEKLKKKLAAKEAICKELQESPEKLNTALLWSIRESLIKSTESTDSYNLKIGYLMAGSFVFAALTIVVTILPPSSNFLGLLLALAVLAYFILVGILVIRERPKKGL
jgi:hypothetical protein